MRWVLCPYQLVNQHCEILWTWRHKKSNVSSLTRWTKVKYLPWIFPETNSHFRGPSNHLEAIAATGWSAQVFGDYDVEPWKLECDERRVRNVRCQIRRPNVSSTENGNDSPITNAGFGTHIGSECTRPHLSTTNQGWVAKEGRKIDPWHDTGRQGIRYSKPSWWIQHIIYLSTAINYFLSKF